jgi:hypothetical protein
MGKERTKVNRHRWQVRSSRESNRLSGQKALIRSSQVWPSSVDASKTQDTSLRMTALSMMYVLALIAPLLAR